MKNFCYALALALLCALVPRTQAQMVGQVSIFDTRDYLNEGDLFYPEEGATISWMDGAIEIKWDGQNMVVNEQVDRFGRLHFFASPDPDGEDGVLPDDFVFMEGYITINNQGLPKLTIDTNFIDRVHAQRINTVYDRNGRDVVFVGKLCECKDGQGLSCKAKECDKGGGCSAGTSTCYWKPVKDDPVRTFGP